MDYGRIERPTVFRFCLLKNIIDNAKTDVTVMMDTNQCAPGKQAMPDEDYLAQQGLRYAVMPAPNDPRMFFGFKLAGGPGRIGNEPQSRIIIDMGGGAWAEELFGMMTACDVAIGIGRKKAFEELREAYRFGGEKILFDRNCFEHSLYDSVICARMRSTMDLTPHLEAVKNEMGL